MSKTKSTIIQKNSNLFSLQIKYIDAQTIIFIETIYFKNYQQSASNKALLNRFLKLFNAFCYLKQYRLKYLNLLNQELSVFLSEYAYFLKHATEIETVKFIRILEKIIHELNQNSVRNIILNKNLSLDLSKFDKKSIKYLNGWRIKQSNRTNFDYIQLNDYCDIHGFNEADKIESILNNVNNVFPLYLFNDFISYLNKDNSSIFNLEKYKLTDFIKEYFTNKEDIDIYNKKKEWNTFIDILNNHFKLNEKFNLKFLITGSKSTEIIRIKTINNKQYKDKLISLVPLEIKDEKALAILKEKVDQDIKLISEWAKYILEELKQSRLTKRCLKPTDYNISPEELRKKYGFLKHVANREIFDIDTIFNEKHLFAVCSLLIIDHSEITESFIEKCDYHSLVSGIHSANLFLVSKKSRRGPELAEQKIILNENTKSVIQDYLFLTKDLRENLILNNNKLKDTLFTCCTANQPLKIKQPLEFKTSSVQQSIHDFLTNKGYSNEDAQYYSNSISLTKIRATRAIQIYFQTESTSKMAEALGHHKYNANLLSHYLPKSILDFFQERWIRIFQKGIIIEAMKDSNFILQATKFENMEAVNDFLKNHTFKFKTTELEIKTDIALNNETTSYISINEVNLQALVSIHEAVTQSPKKELINENAFYWSSFYEHLKKIIENDYKNFSFLLESCIKKSDPSIFTEVIYA